jgi:hypothetical protein
MQLTIIDNPDTGESLMLKNGQWVPVVIENPDTKESLTLKQGQWVPAVTAKTPVKDVPGVFVPADTMAEDMTGTDNYKPAPVAPESKQADSAVPAGIRRSNLTTRDGLLKNIEYGVRALSHHGIEKPLISIGNLLTSGRYDKEVQDWEKDYQSKIPNSLGASVGAVTGDIGQYLVGPEADLLKGLYQYGTKGVNALTQGFIKDGGLTQRTLGGAASGLLTGAASTAFIPETLQPKEGGGGYWDRFGNRAVDNAMVGAGVGAFVPQAGGLYSLLSDKVGQVGNLFTEAGGRRIADKYVRGLSGKDNNIALSDALLKPKTYVAGSKPTASEVVSEMPSGTTLQAHQKIVAEESGGQSAKFGERTQEQIAARQNALGWAGTDADKQALITARTNAVKPLYEAVQQSNGSVDTTSVRNLLTHTIQTNALNKPLVAPLVEIVSDLGIAGKSAETNPQRLKSLSDKIGGWMTDKKPDGSPAYDVKILREVKQRLDKQIGIAEPKYQEALDTFKALSTPINAMEIGQTLRDKLINATGMEKPGDYLRLLADEKRLLRKSIDFAGKGIDAYLTPKQLKSINDVALDLERNLASKNPLQKTNIRGGLNVANETTLSLPNLLSRPAMMANYVLKSMGKNIEPSIDAYFAKLYLNPVELGKVLASSPPNKRAIINDRIQAWGRAYVGSRNAATATTAQPQEQQQEQPQ